MWGNDMWKDPWVWTLLGLTAMPPVALLLIYLGWGVLVLVIPLAGIRLLLRDCRKAPHNSYEARERDREEREETEW